jgi:cystathionine gamma-synthase|eukprot:COSAG01_NODE_888_length_12915_cov_10.708723_10_plen_124_part_00
MHAARSIAGYAALSCKPAVVVDSTFAPPPLQRALALGATAVMHATTKYLAGHSDVMGGAVCVGDPALAAQLRAQRTAMGGTPGSLEVWLLLRSLRTLSLRVGESKRLVVESPWSQFTSECQRF